MDSYYTLVDNQAKEREQLHKRMDDDLGLLYLNKYVLRDKNNLAVPDIINTTLNKPRVFFDNVVSGLQATSQQVVVESDNRNLDTHYIEGFQDAAFNAIGQRLHAQGKPALSFHTDAQLCGRGRAARLVAFHMKDGVLIPDVPEWDARNVYFEYGDDGLRWGANFVPRKAADIEADYPEQIKKYHISLDGKENLVLDVWAKDVHEIWINKSKAVEEPNPYGFCNVVLGIVPLGYGDIFLQKDRAMYEGESIFAAVRDIIPELNRLISMLSTLNHKQVMAALQYKNPEGTPQDEPPEYPRSRDVVSTGKGDISPIDYGDARNAATMVFNMLEKAMEEGSLTSIDLGNLQFPLADIALARIGRGKDRVYLPRLNTRALINQQTAEMFTKQCLSFGIPIELGVPGHKKTFELSKLEGEYSTTYKYFLKDAESDRIRLTMADAASKYFDPETVLKETLEVADWQDVMRKRYYYRAAQLDPNVAMYETINAALELADKGDKIASRKAQIMAETLKLNLVNIKAGKMTQPIQPLAPSEGGGPPMPLIPPARQGSPGASQESLIEKSAPAGGE